MNWWDKPFSLVVDEEPWAVLTDKVFLVAIRGPNKLPPLKAPWGEERGIASMLRMTSKDSKTTSIQRLQEFLETDEYATFLGFAVDTELLGKALSKLRKVEEVSLWDASCSLFTYKCLGLFSGTGWRAFVMGIKDTWGDLPTYDFEEDPDAAARELFEKVMGEDPPVEASEPEGGSSPPVPDGEPG